MGMQATLRARGNGVVGILNGVDYREWDPRDDPRLAVHFSPDDLRGPGIYDQVPFPGAPGTTAIAGHRTTYLAPFRHIDRLKRGDAITIEMPYGRFSYEVEKRRIVAPTEVSVVKRVGFDRLVLSMQGWVMYARRPETSDVTAAP